MAQKKKAKAKKRSWLKVLFLYVFLPLFIWFAAFWLWLYWDSVTALFSGCSEKARPTKRERKVDGPTKSEQAPAKRSQEKILEEDRKRLDDILKQRQ